MLLLNRIFLLPVFLLVLPFLSLLSLLLFLQSFSVSLVHAQCFNEEAVPRMLCSLFTRASRVAAVSAKTTLYRFADVLSSCSCRALKQHFSVVNCNSTCSSWVFFCVVYQTCTETVNFQNILNKL